MNLRYVLVSAVWLAGFLCRDSSAAPIAGKHEPPKLMLWSWYARGDFRPLPDRGEGVAYLALSLQLRGNDDVIPSPRETPVRIPPNLYRMAVIRFNAAADPPHRPAFSVTQRELAVKMVLEIAAIAHPQALQIDFDAPQSAWPFYRFLLSEIRARLAPDTFLSMTALVSWCDASQSWLAGMPVDEIVPMAFAMGQAAAATATMLRRGGQFKFAGCRTSIGIEVPGLWPGRDSDQLVSPRKGQRAYFFPGVQGWSPELLSTASKSFTP